MNNKISVHNGSPVGNTCQPSPYRPGGQTTLLLSSWYERWSVWIFLGFVAMVGNCTEFGFCAGPDTPSAVEAAASHWSPRIQWIAQQRFRGAYNYSFEIPWFAEAKDAGINAVITRLEIPNSSQQAEELRNSVGDDYWMIRDLNKVKATGQAAK